MYRGACQQVFHDVIASNNVAGLPPELLQLALLNVEIAVGRSFEPLEILSLGFLRVLVQRPKLIKLKPDIFLGQRFGVWKVSRTRVCEGTKLNSPFTSWYGEACGDEAPPEQIKSCLRGLRDYLTSAYASRLSDRS